MTDGGCRRIWACTHDLGADPTLTLVANSMFGTVLSQSSPKSAWIEAVHAPISAARAGRGRGAVNSPPDSLQHSCRHMQSSGRREGGRATVPIDLQSDCHDSYPSKNNGLQLTWPG